MKTTYFKRFTRLFVVMLLAMLPAMSWAQTYISDVAVSCHRVSDMAKEELTNAGYTVLDADWNQGVGEFSHRIYIGYKTTTDPMQAITNLIVMEGKEYKCDGTNKQQIVDGMVYRPIKAFGKADGDFDAGCEGSKSIYLWYTKDVTGGAEAITSLECIVNGALENPNYAKWFDGTTLKNNCNLNDGGYLGGWLFLLMNKSKPAQATFKRNFTTWTNTNNTGKAYLRFYDIAKYFGIDEPNGDNNVSAVYLTEIKIDGVAYSSFHTGEVQITTSGDKNTFAAGGVTVTTLNSTAANGGTKKTGFPVATSYKYRYEINYPHQNVNEIQLTGYIVVNGEKRNWFFVLHKELDMNFTYPYHTANGQLYLRYSDIFRFLGYDVSEGALNSFRPLVAQVDGVPCAAVSQQEISGLGNAKGVRVGTYSDAGVTIRTVNTSYVRGLIADDVPSGQEDCYGVTITYPRNKRKKYVLQMYVSYTYTTNSTYANNEEEDYKMFYVVLDPDFPRMKEGKIKPGETIDINSLGTYFTGAICNLTGENASDASISGTNFTSNVEGVYNIDVYKGTNKIDATRIHVSKHNYPYYEFNYEADNASASSNQQYVHFQHDIDVSYLPAWDFESQVGGKNVRFCINDDEETVTLVAATPILIKRHTETGLPIAEFDEDHSKYNTFSKNAHYTGFPWKEFDVNSYNQHLWDGDGNVIFDVNYISAYGINTDVLEIPQTVVYDGKSYTVTKIGDGALPYTRRTNSTGTLFVVKANSIKLPTSIKEIGYSAFYQTNASAVNFEELVNLESIGAQAFYQSKIANVDLTKCTELQNIGVDKTWDDLGSVFYGCTQLKKVDISGLQNLRFLSASTFRECTKLEELDMHDCVQIDWIPSYFCYGCTSLHLPNMDNCPIEYIGNTSFYNCNFAGQTFDCRRLKAPYPNGKWKGFTVCFEKTGLKNMILPPFEGNSSDYILLLVKDSNTKPAFENIFIFEFGEFQSIIFQYEGSNKDINIFMSQYNKPQNILDNNSIMDAHGPRVFPMISSNTSGVRTMSYFRPLDYKNIKVFDNTHFYDADKSDGTHYNLEDFFRTPENIAKNNIEMLTPYIATDYNVENKEVTMTALSETTPGIQTKGGIYYKGTGTSTDTEGNEIFYVLTEPEYSVGGYSKSYTNMYTETNYLKGGGKESVVLDKAPHMTETSTQFISKGGTFYYSTPGTLAPYKAYLDIPEFICTIADPGYGSQQVSALSFVWNDEEDDTATAVDAIKDNSPVTKDYFNMQGMKVKTPVSGGIYIHNGRKILVK